MEVDGGEFCGLGGEVRTVRPVRRGGVCTQGNKVIYWSQVKNGHVATLGQILHLRMERRSKEGLLLFQGAEQFPHKLVRK